MSIVLYVYSPDPPLTRGSIADFVRHEGLPEELRWETVFLRDPDALEPDGPGTVANQQVLAWRPRSPQAERIRAVLDARDRAGLEALYAEDAVASTWVDVVARGDERWEDGVNEESIGAAPPPYRTAIENAACWYVVETSAARNDLSLEFQRELWIAIGVASNGVIEDPQEGEYASGSEEEEEEEEDAGGPWPSATAEAVRGPASFLRGGAPAGERLFTAALLLVVLAEVAAAGFRIAWGDVGRVWLHALGIGLVALGWYLVRSGDRTMYWVLVAYAWALVAMWLRPAAAGFPRADAGEGILLLLRLLAFAAAGILFLLPATRRWARSLSAPP